MRKTKRLMQNIALLLVVIFVMVVFLELALKLLDIPKYSTPSDEYRRSDEVIHHAFIPNSEGRLGSSEFDTYYSINSYGLRDNEPGIKARYRILMLGDSYTEGVGVNLDETIPKQLEAMLDSAGYDVQVINGGVHGYSPMLEYLYLRNYGLGLEPDMVILNLDLSDVSDDYKLEKIAVFNSSGLVAVPGSRTDSSTWRGNIEYFCMKYRLSLCILAGRSFYRLTDLDMQPMGLIEGDIQSDPWFMTRYNVTEQQKEHYQRTFGYINDISQLCREGNITFVLVNYPHGHQVSAMEWKKGRAVWHLDEHATYPLDFFTDVADFAGKNKILYIDTYYKFNGTAEYPLFYSLDNHMTAKGYRLVAEGIFEYLKSNGLVLNAEEQNTVRRALGFP